jgi:periplasmic divalent cation tolerance protein
MKYSLGYITAPTKTEAKKIVLELLENRLIACANILLSADSLYVWDNEIREEKEVIIILKTQTSNEEGVIYTVKKMHSYECPCIVFLPLTNGSKEFFWWIDSCC